MYIIRQKRGSKVSISEMSNSRKKCGRKRKQLETVWCPEVKERKKQQNLPNWAERIPPREIGRQNVIHSLTGQFYQRNNRGKLAYMDFDESA